MNFVSFKKLVRRSLLLAVLVSAPVMAQTELKWIWADHLPELYEVHNAAWQTPVALPPSAVRWKYDRAQGQAQGDKFLQRDESVIEPIEFVGDEEPLDPPSQTVEAVVITPGRDQ